MPDDTPKQTIDSPIIKQPGTTQSERYLHRLADKSFLTLWSYPGVYRDQGPKASEGKEVCDLLVVHGDSLILFSDKDCAFPSSGTTQLNWTRWYRRAICKSADQVWGAERWIKSQPKRLYLDRRCTKPFPLRIPDPAVMNLHRVLVTHGAEEACKLSWSNHGSFSIDTRIKAEQHHSEHCMPLTIGDIDPSRGFVHVLNRESLDLLLTSLDTICDFTSYLRRRELLFREAGNLIAYSEHDLLALYMSDVDDNGEHFFPAPPGSITMVDPDFWTSFSATSKFRSLRELNEISYSWDRIIETFSRHILSRTTTVSHKFSLADEESALRLLASEGRVARRVLAKALKGAVTKPNPGQRLARILQPPRPGSPHYVMLILPHSPNITDEQYRNSRLNTLESYCLAMKLRFPAATDIIGIATECMEALERSFDVYYLDSRTWSAQQQRLGEEALKRGILSTQGPFQKTTEHEYSQSP